MNGSNNTNTIAENRRQYLYWVGTIPRDSWSPSLRDGLRWIKGQPEVGEAGYEHWQVVFSTTSKSTLAKVRRIWHPIVGHWEPSRSSAADLYVWKEDSRDGEPFEFGEKPFKRNSTTDWAVVKQNAIDGQFDTIPPDIYVRYYASLIRIRSDHLRPVAVLRECIVYWGPTGTGKSRTAWESAGIDAYPKDPRSKFWCGYRGEENVIIDEFRGGIDISHLLRWLDRYPVRVEIKGGSQPLMAKKLWITSNIKPEEWYPDIDWETQAALIRRLTVINMQ